MSAPSPIEQVALDIIELEAQRANLYLQFKNIEDALQYKRKLVETFQFVKDSADLQQSLITEMKNIGAIPQ